MNISSDCANERFLSSDKSVSYNMLPFDSPGFLSKIHLNQSSHGGGGTRVTFNGHLECPLASF
jgi:hypothetical protein